MANYKIIPFDLIDLKQNGKRNKNPFIKNVENVLRNDLQIRDSFGCRILKCHTHAGSKLHFDDFTEAELLFQNSYYNRNFAILTYKSIIKRLQNNNELEQIVLIGYENYSELFLQELTALFDFGKQYSCGHCVYETVSNTLNGKHIEEVHIKNFCSFSNGKIKLYNGSNYRNYDYPKTLFVFIVPINTTLTTMDKMIAKFKLEFERSQKDEEITCFDLSHCEFISLITLSDSEQEQNGYWKWNEKKGVLTASKDRFEYINNLDVHNFVMRNVACFPVKKCEQCYPDQNGKRIDDETPMFGVNRASVVPMLKVGVKGDLIPLPTLNDLKKENKELMWVKDLQKVWRLSNYLLQDHIALGENHFQFYFKTDKFIEQELTDHSDELSGFLKNVNLTLFQRTNIPQNIPIFDYIVSPRHRTNSRWVHLVNERIFNGVARILYFDIDKEYRSNIKAKYSDITSSLRNRASSKQGFVIRFHFVDDTIHSGTNFLRAKNLVKSILKDVKFGSNQEFKLFDSAILVLNRLSRDSKEFYIEDDNFFCYVDANVSAMRHHEDACSLCKLGFDYDRIQENCATNELALRCSEVKMTHKLKSADDACKNLDDITKLEKRLVLFITHLLNKRLHNKLYLSFEVENKRKGKAPNPIDVEGSDIDKIVELLKLYYENETEIIDQCCDIEKKHENKIVWRIAFIKVISRPFFIYHIRCCQAAFKFCINELSKMLDAEVYSNDNSMLIQTLVKALSDMNANYIVREKIINKLIDLAKQTEKSRLDNKLSVNELNNKKFEIYVEKNVLKPDSLVHYIKKNVVLSRDVSKSLLLENVLLDGETLFFCGNEVKYSKSNMSKRIHFFENDLLTIYGKLYLENNVILNNVLSSNDMLDKLIAMAKQSQADHFYLFDNFREIWQINTGRTLEESEMVFVRYRELQKSIAEFYSNQKPNKEDFSCKVNNFITEVENLFFKEDNSARMKALAFLHDVDAMEEPLFSFFTVAGNPQYDESNKFYGYDGLTPSQAFFHDDNILAIKNRLDKKSGAEKDDGVPDLFCIENKLGTDKNKKSLIIRFGSNEIGNNSAGDAAIYLQIWNFDACSQCDFFILKLLLTLRNSFVKLIEEIKILEYIEKRKVFMKELALSISKASTHSNAENYFDTFIKLYLQDGSRDTPNSKDRICSKLKISKENQDYCTIDTIAELIDKINDKQYSGEKNDNLRYLSEKHIEKLIMNMRSDSNCKDIIFDKYYQLLADETISSLYRKIIKKDVTCETSEFNFLKMWGSIFELNYDKNTKNYTSSITVVQSGTCNNCKIIFVGFDGAELKSSFKVAGAINSLVLIVLLLAMNVVKHGAKSDYTMEVFYSGEDSSIICSNKLKSHQEDEINEQYLKIPPWIFDKNNCHITLWTLLHLGDYNENKISIKRIPDRENFKLVIKFKE